MQLNKKNNIHKKVERYTLVLVFVCFIIIAGKYTYISFISNNPNSIPSKIKDFELKRQNADYLKRKEHLKREKNQKMLTLKRYPKNNWVVINRDNTISKEYKIENNNGKIAIRKLNGTKKIDINIKEVNDYFSQSGYIITDIPYSDKNESYTVAEQEDSFPIFGYHNVFKQEKNIKNPFMDIREQDFVSQVNFFNKKMNCRWLTLKEVVQNYILKENKIPRNTCVMTFDDGRKNNYNVVFPILQKSGINATFFVIFSRLNQKGYMSRSNVGKLFRSGNEIGSHTLSGGSMVHTDWFKGTFTDKELKKQIIGSKKIFDDYFFNVKTFAYPLGEWNNKVVSLVKKAGYIAARGTEKERGRDPRSPAISWDNNFIWHLHYYKPELRYNEEIEKEVGYNGWWQFEEGYKIEKDSNNNIRELPYTPKPNSYFSVNLSDVQDKISNKFIISRNGLYNIEIFGTVNTKNSTGYSNEDTIKVYIDNNEKMLEKNNNKDKECRIYEKQYYCSYIISTNLNKGVHTISIESQQKEIKLDKFRIFRKVKMKENYSMKVVEY